jgi:signal transduction histidine kinase
MLSFDELMAAGAQTPRWFLLLAFTAVASSFVGATVFTTYSSHHIDEASLSIAGSAMPSIRHLAAARADLRELQILFHDAITKVEAGQPVTKRLQIERTRAALATELEAYWNQPAYPGERQLRTTLNQDRQELEAASDRTLSSIDARDARSARNLFDHDLRIASDATSSGIAAAIELNADVARDLASRVQRAHRRSIRVAVTLDAVAVLLTGFAAMLVLRALRRAERKREAHNQLLAARANELEQFAGRVAHDILSPLGAAGLVFSVFEHKLASEPTLRDLNARGVASVARVQRIVDGLLEFARAGARPDPRARADVREVTLDVATELRPAADEAFIELLVDPPPPCGVSASPGVLTSLLSNLLRNAIKYMGDSPVRRVQLSIEENADRVHFEVSDTGPGLPAELGEHVFEPYVRGRHSKQPGIGLGLATVRKMVEAHGGRIGVDSRPGRGTRFWFELPRASHIVEIPQPALLPNAPN